MIVFKLILAKNEQILYMHAQFTSLQKSEYNQEIPQSHTAGKFMVLRGRVTEH